MTIGRKRPVSACVLLSASIWPPHGTAVANEGEHHEAVIAELSTPGGDSLAGRVRSAATDRARDRPRAQGERDRGRAGRLAARPHDRREREPGGMMRPETGPLSTEELRKMDAYWRAANYLSVGQIYPYDHALLKGPPGRGRLQPRPLRPRGTPPGPDRPSVPPNP